jgi:hypothetical protein
MAKLYTHDPAAQTADLSITYNTISAGARIFLKFFLRWR